ncbi:hypothetical protein FNV43_RR06505 [Rhamnella rubrinervis]|uniref:non-specific serine/threonine protein kinase n=1 Tax=Rhamnella rubrinervis TaxID=2594499 RepID=A0A8K0MLG7_9ROSA|nr:hypothetical protein FNV43_RR06505 [Rhamnella rubrinervis]
MIEVQAHSSFTELVSSAKSGNLIMLAKNLLAFLIVATSCFRVLRFAESKLPQEEVDALEQITRTMGTKHWKFNGDSCQIEMVGLTPEPSKGANSSIDCECEVNNSSACHVVKIVLKGHNLPGMLPPQLVKLPFLQEIDFSYNYLNGTIPGEWASLKLTLISLVVNRLSGEIPEELGDITTLRYLMLSSNQLTGNLPVSLAGLSNLVEFRINDNNFNGSIPDFIQNWRKLNRLELHASGLEGPIPSNISLLSNLVELRISDIYGPEQKFPMLESITTTILKLVLRNCNISGKIPSYIWMMKNLEVLDLSFNKLVGEIPATISLERVRFLFLTSNLLSGTVPDSILKDGTSVSFDMNRTSQPSIFCLVMLMMQDHEVESSSFQLGIKPKFGKRNQWRDGGRGREWQRDEGYGGCLVGGWDGDSTCMHVNSGGNDVTVKEEKRRILYEGDGGVEGGTAKYFLNSKNYWGFSSTGDFMDDNNFQNARYTATLQSSNISELYETARISPISLTYFHHCLENGNYTDKLALKDFNIEDKARKAQEPIVIPLKNVSVTNNILEIRFYFGGKGTTRIPKRGVYGPLISAISVVSDSKHCSYGRSETKKTAHIIAGVVVGLSCLIFVSLGFLWRKGYFQGRRRRQGPDLQTGTFTLKQIKAATDDFNEANKIGEGALALYTRYIILRIGVQGQLPDGTVIAVKQLSSKSRQGNHEFLNEIGMITCVQHPNLVKLHGCCIEADQLLLVYEFMENNSLSRALFGPGNQLKLDWPTRHRICIGIARGLAFLHEESRLKIVHRDIKTTNVLLDGDLNPKISDFGLAKLDEEGKSHISTRVAGTIGYMAPEYALWGHLTYKADVYSFGVVALEVVSGKNNNSYVPTNNSVCLLDWACHVQQTGNLLELIDEKLGSDTDIKEAEIMVKVALLCTNASASLRPTMSEVVSMLEGRISVPDVVPEASSYSGDLRLKSLKDLHQSRVSQSWSGSQTQNSATLHTFCSTSTSDVDLSEINRDLASS